MLLTLPHIVAHGVALEAFSQSVHRIRDVSPQVDRPLVFPIYHPAYNRPLETREQVQVVRAHEYR